LDDEMVPVPVVRPVPFLAKLKMDYYPGGIESEAVSIDAGLFLGLSQARISIAIHLEDFGAVSDAAPRLRGWCMEKAGKIMLVPSIMMPLNDGV
jgi:hypothetical protein